MPSIYSMGLGIGTRNSANQWLEVFYPAPLLKPSASLCSILSTVIQEAADPTDCPLSDTQLKELANELRTVGETEQAHIADQLAASGRTCVLSVFVEDVAPVSVPGAYLKLQLLSHRLVKPNETALTGLFRTLPNVAWTNQGAIDPEDLPQRQFNARLTGQILTVEGVDKFPKMTNYVVPKGVRIAHTARVRLGAYIGEGTTIMHEGFVNFNGGTLGASMIEGRISAGVVIGEGSDLGGGCSTMGTLSGGGDIIISVGRQCLVGANAGIAIPLGDRCTVESGLYVTAGAKLNLLDEGGNVVRQVKARELAGQSDLLFRRNSLSGAIECKTNQTAIALNEVLHANN